MIRPGRIVVLGAGELASGVALRLHHCGFTILMTEIAEPRAVRRLVAFSEAVYDGGCRVEGIRAVRIDSIADSDRVRQEGAIPVIVDPGATAWREWKPDVLIDGRMKKGGHRLGRSDANRLIGLGPGFTAGEDCHFVIETSRGHSLGRVISDGRAAKNTGIPGELGGESVRRVFRSPADGIFQSHNSLGDFVHTGDELGTVSDLPVLSALDGVLRGQIRPGIEVSKGEKIGDVDPRPETPVRQVSEKALAIAGGVVEAILRR